MKNILIFCITVLSSICSGSGRAEAQATMPGNIHETGQLFTDRTLYVTGEAVQFSAIHRTEMDSGLRILYVELITPEGKKINGGKYLLKQGRTYGCLNLPVDMLTGLYYLRSYTRIMRNDGPSAYQYVPLRVINPVKSELQASGKGDSIDLAGDPVSMDCFELENLKPQYSAREQAVVNIRGKITGAERAEGLCITIIPEGTAKVPAMHLDLSGHRNKEHEQYFSENRGISISGKLMDKDQKKPVPDQVVTLSVMGNKDFSAYKTDQNGRFFFTLPDDTGTHDIFLSSVDFSGSGVSLLIDNDYCSVPVKLPNPEFRISEAEKKIALNLAVNSRITSEYQTGETSRNDTLSKQKEPFYGEPSISLVMDRFIQLPTLQEYFDEIPLDVKIRERKGGKYFKFFSTEAGMLVNDPLVMVDWVVITDIKKVLSIPPQKISRIEIVNKPYVKGNLTYGGIVSILSREGDFAGIDLPGSGLFVKYDFLAPACQNIFAKPVASNVPDSRNTVLWDPDFQMKPGTGSNRIVFNTPDTQGGYLIVIRGILPDGRFFSQQAAFTVTGQ
jgi:hypothetical protein